MSRRKTNKNNKKDTYGVLLIAFTLSILAAGFYYYVDENNNKILRDKEDNCRLDGYVAKESVLLVDTTDSVNSTQYQAIKNKLEELLDNAILDERVSVYTITDDTMKIAPLLTTCNPGDGADKNEWTSNKSRLKQNWELKFKEKLETTVIDILDSELAKQSPILDTIKSVGVFSFASSKAKAKQLIIISDLLHHTVDLSHYRTPKLAFSSVENSPYIAAMLTNLGGAEIEVLYITRQKDYTLQGRTHLLFWEKYFEKSNGVLTKIININ
jgi:hypothetical protein